MCVLHNVDPVVSNDGHQGYCWITGKWSDSLHIRFLT